MIRRAICILLMLALAAPACGEALLDSWDMVRKVRTRENMYLVCRDGKWGMADGENRVLVQPRYDEIGPFARDGIANVCLEEKWGLIRDDGEILLEPVLREAPLYKGEYAVASITSDTIWEDFSGVQEFLPLYGVIDRTGREIIPFDYDEIEFTPDGSLLRVELNDRCGYMDLSGKYVIEPRYVNIDLFEGEYAVATLPLDGPGLENNSFDFNYADGVIDRQGNTVIPFDYDGLFLDENGLVRARQGEQWGCLNLENEVVVEFKYAALNGFVGGYAAAAVRVDLPPGSYDSLDYTLDWGVIDGEGNEILPFEYGQIYIGPDGLIETGTDGKTRNYRIDAQSGKAIREQP